MQRINFTKMVASGNDFVLIDKSHQVTMPAGRQASFQSLAKKMCDRKFGVGADGLLILEKSKIADIRMRIFNADGSEAEMCGNGARCSALYLGKSNVSFQAKAGIIKARVQGEKVKINLTGPRGRKSDIPLKAGNRNIRVNFINTGVPHAVIFVEGLDSIDVFNLGRAIRYHNRFAPAGANVNFVETLNANSIKIRTYERGVEDETLACGTGSVASALIFALKTSAGNKVNVQTKSGEVLKVYFQRHDNKFSDVWLEGKAEIVYKGVYHV